MRTNLMRAAVGLLLLAPALAGCGGGGSHGDGASIVVTTNILGDIVRNLVGPDAHVEVVMPPNANPHDFAPSARQAQDMHTADVLVANGLAFEAGLDDTIDAAVRDGVTVVRLTDLAPDLLELPGGAKDPHVFTDPARMAVAVDRLAAALARHVPALDTAAFRSRSAAYVAGLHALDEEVASILDAVPSDRRVLVTNHEVFGYFADRYRFEVVGAVIPALTTLAEPSGAALADLADLMRRRHVPAVFAETSAPRRLADALAAEGTNVSVVELFGESLGSTGSGGDTYLGMMRTNAHRIADGLAPGDPG